MRCDDPGVKPRGKQSHPDEAFALRVGAAALGMFAGMALGLLLGGLTTRLASFVFGGAAAGVVTGLLFPEVAMALASATLHFFIGFFGGFFRASSALALDDEDHLQLRHSTAKPWLSAGFVFGVVFAAAVWVLR